MANGNLKQNERSWAIDVIIAINNYCHTKKKEISKASGEWGLKVEGKTLFPDVFLSSSDGSVLHGWELKMPDVPISDNELITNAISKALSLSSNSLLLWNGKEAVLYKRAGNSKTFNPIKNWSEPKLITREDIAKNPALWNTLLIQILEDLNQFFESGELQATRPEVVLGENLVTWILNEVTDKDVAKLQEAIAHNADLEAEIDQWWTVNVAEHAGQEKLSVLAQVNIINWLNRLLFSQYLKGFNKAATQVDQIAGNVTIPQAQSILNKISAECDFLNIFQSSIADNIMSESGWDIRVRFNALLVDICLNELPQATLRNVLDNALTLSRQKLSGQFSTPELLSRLLVLLTLNDRSLPVIDPCCGTGTIARAAYDIKKELGFSTPDALSTVWACDKFQFPLQLTSIALSDANAMGEVVQVFKSDVFDIQNVKSVNFIDPSQAGKSVDRELPKFHAIVSNLPFVRFEDSAALNPNQVAAISRLRLNIKELPEINGRADLYAHIIPCLRSLLSEGGRVGVVTSNSWLGTQWGENFREILFKLFKVTRVVISGNGRWFLNADVVTALLILERREDVSSKAAPSEITYFCTTLTKITEWDDQRLKVINTELRGKLQRRTVLTHVEPHRLDEIKIRETLGLGWVSMFVDTTWLNEIGKSLIKVNSLFYVGRGERRGWDELFYPSGEHNIETEYLQPVLKSSRSQTSLMASPDGSAFCCSATEEELRGLKHFGALAWIDRFRHATNEKGKPLPEVLARPKCSWYEMRPDTRALLAISMNPGEVLSIYRFKKPTFVNQRLISFIPSKLSAELVPLAHALLNSLVGLFLIESAGFGRGLGALDLNASKLNDYLMMLDPSKIKPESAGNILTAFKPLENRQIRAIPIELQLKDREIFDRAVLNSYGVENLYEKVKNALLQLFLIRDTARADL